MDEKGSCIVASIKNDEVVISREFCQSHNLFLCERIQGFPIPKTISQSIDDVIKTAEVNKGYKHTANSMSACAVYCGNGKIVFNATTCACLDNESSSHDELNGECEIIIPCPGNVLQACGCKVSGIKTIFPIFIEGTSGNLLDKTFS